MEKRTLISSTNYMTIQGWMITDLGLASNSLLVYAVIYGFSQDGMSWFEGTREYLAEWCGRINVKTVSRILDDLLAQGLIEKQEISINHVKYCNYRAVLAAIPGRDVPEEAPKEASPGECQRGTKGVGTFCPHPENSGTIDKEIRQIMFRIRKNKEQEVPEPPGTETDPVLKGSEGGRDILSPGVGTFCPGGRDILSHHNKNINNKRAGNQSINQDLQSVSGKDDRLIDGAGESISGEDIEEEVRERIGAGNEEREEVCEMIADILKSRKEFIRIGREELPASDVKKRFRKLNSHHVDYVLECIRAQSEKISNYRQYVLTALYNAPSTMNGFYAARVREDMQKYIT